MSFTIVPLNNLDLPIGSHIQFGPKFVLQDVPEWLKRDEHTVANVDVNERQRLKDAKHALISEYYADSYGHPDPEWSGPKHRSIQDLRFQSAFLASTALWLRQPSHVSFTAVYHALTYLNGRTCDPPIVIHIDREGPYYPHPKDQHNPFQLRHIIDSAKLCEILETVPRNTPLWASLRSLSAALLSYFPDYRYPLFWQALESLFTDETKDWRVTERLRNRISYFLARNANEQEDLSRLVNNCYRMRSKIVHGRLSEWPEVESQMAQTEGIVRTAIRHVLEKPGMLQVFISSRRDEFLDAWVDSRAFTPPALPS
jgi:hypothetical protein